MRALLVALLATATVRAETHMFQTEVSRLLDIIINSLYSQKEVFLREAISNASDALDKIRFIGVQDSRQLDLEPELCMRITTDKEAETLTIEDTGVGMSHADLVNNLGTIARSGTTQFLEAIARSSSLNLIGQFGVGFYSYFLVAAEVTVISKHADDAQHVWRSSAGASFTLERDDVGPFLKRGTRVILKLKKEAKEFLEPKRIRELVTKYSEFINFPIFLHVSHEVEKEIDETPIEEDLVSNDDTTPRNDTPSSEDTTPKDEATPSEDTTPKDDTTPIDDITQKDDTTPKDEKDGAVEEKPVAKKKVKETVWEWEQLNAHKALWLRPIEELKHDDYRQFYRVLAKDSFEDPLAWVHFRAEGEVEFTALLYIPKRMPRQFDDETHAKTNVRLYVRRVLIGDDFRELLPRYLGFVQGVVDSDDLPINVSRESLQQLRALKTVKKKLVRKVLEKLERLAGVKAAEGEKAEEGAEAAEKRATRRKRYEDIWKEYGKAIKLGVVDDASNRDKLAALLLYRSTFNDTQTLVSFADYKSRLQPNQTDIFYLGGDAAKDMLTAPMVRSLARLGYEVLLMDEPIDEYATQILGKFNDLKLTNIGKAGFKLPQNEQEKADEPRLAKLYQPLVDYLRRVLPDVAKVTLNAHIAPEPLIVLGAEMGYSAHLEKIARAQAVTHNADQLNTLNLVKRNVQLNPFHPFVKELLDRLTGGENAETERVALSLYETGLVNSGYALREPAKFAARVYRLLGQALGLPADVDHVELDLASVQLEEPAKEPVADEEAAPESFDELVDSPAATDPVSVDQTAADAQPADGVEQLSGEL